MIQVAMHVLTYNSATQIDACLSCLLQQDYSNATITVIDNASTDDTLARLAPWQAKGVRVVAHPQNLYYAQAHNLAIAASTAEVIVTVNPDVLLTPTFLSTVIACFAQDPAIGSVNGKLLLLDDVHFTPSIVTVPIDSTRLIDSAGLMLYRSRRPYLRGNRQSAHDHCLESGPIFGVDGACAAYRRTMLEDIALNTTGQPEYFDNDFLIYREDVDLAWRAQLFGWVSYYAANAVGYHVRSFHLGRDREQMSPFLRRHSVKNGWLLLLKNDELRALLLDLPFILPYQLKILGGLLTIERSSLGAIKDLWQLWPRFRAKRATIHRRRRRTMRELRHWLV